MTKNTRLTNRAQAPTSKRAEKLTCRFITPREAGQVLPTRTFQSRTRNLQLSTLGVELGAIGPHWQIDDLMADQISARFQIVWDSHAPPRKPILPNLCLLIPKPSEGSRPACAILNQTAPWPLRPAHESPGQCVIYAKNGSSVWPQYPMRTWIGLEEMQWVAG